MSPGNRGGAWMRVLAPVTTLPSQRPRWIPEAWISCAELYSFPTAARNIGILNIRACAVRFLRKGEPSCQSRASAYLSGQLPVRYAPAPATTFISTPPSLVWHPVIGQTASIRYRRAAPPQLRPTRATTTPPSPPPLQTPNSSSPHHSHQLRPRASFIPLPHIHRTPLRIIANAAHPFG